MKHEPLQQCTVKLWLINSSFLFLWPVIFWAVLHFFLFAFRRFYSEPLSSGIVPYRAIVGEVIICALIFTAFLAGYFAFMDSNYIRKVYGKNNRSNKITYGLFLYLFAAIVAIIGFTHIYVEKKLILANNNNNVNIVPNYLVALYFSITTWTTASYGEFQPSLEARPFAAMEAFVSICYMAISLGQITNLIGIKGGSDVKRKSSIISRSRRT